MAAHRMCCAAQGEGYPCTQRLNEDATRKHGTKRRLESTVPSTAVAATATSQRPYTTIAASAAVAMAAASSTKPAATTSTAFTGTVTSDSRYRDSVRFDSSGQGKTGDGSGNLASVAAKATVRQRSYIPSNTTRRDTYGIPTRCNPSKRRDVALFEGPAGGDDVTRDGQNPAEISRGKQQRISRSI